MSILPIVLQLLLVAVGCAADANVTDPTPAELELKDDLKGLQMLHAATAYLSVVSSIALHGNGAGIPVVARQILITRSTYCSDDVDAITFLTSPIQLPIDDKRVQLIIGNILLIIICFVLLFALRKVVCHFYAGTLMVAFPGSGFVISLLYIPLVIEAAVSILRSDSQEQHKLVSVLVSVASQILILILLFVMVTRYSACDIRSMRVLKHLPELLLPTDPPSDLKYCSTKFVGVKKYFFGDGIWCSIRYQSGRGDLGNYLAKMKPLQAEYRNIKKTRGLSIFYELTHVMAISIITSTENVSFGVCTGKNIAIILVLATQIILIYLYEVHISLFVVHMHVLCGFLTLLGVIFQTISFDPVDENSILSWASTGAVTCWYMAAGVLLVVVVYEGVRFIKLHNYVPPIVNVSDDEGSSSNSDTNPLVSFRNLQPTISQTVTLLPSGSDTPMTPLPPAFDQPTLTGTLSEPLNSSSRSGFALHSPKWYAIHSPKGYHLCSNASREKCMFCSIQYQKRFSKKATPTPTPTTTVYV